MAPSIDAATMRVLDAVGVQSIIAPGSGCCGAIRQHLDDHDGARNNIRRNIDAWWPFVDSGEVEAIVINASGCGAMVKDYAHLLRDDTAYAARARRIVALTQDICEFLASNPVSAPPRTQKVAFHPPCTLQHGLKIRGQVEALLKSLGAELVPVRDAHLCCGSAGTYSILQTELSQDLRDPQACCPAGGPLRRSSCRPISAASPTCRGAPQPPSATGSSGWTRDVANRQVSRKIGPCRTPELGSPF